MIQNRRASFDYELLDRFEAGITLTGSEIKSLRAGGVTLGEAFARVKNGEVFLEGMHIPPYKDASYNNHEPLRSRKLLLNKREIAEISKGLERKGLTLVQTRLYFKGGWVKLEVALGRGKNRYDKRQDEAKRDAQRQMERAMKR